MDAEHYRQMTRLGEAYLMSNWKYADRQPCKATMHIELCKTYLAAYDWSDGANIKTDEDHRIGSPRQPGFSYVLRKGLFFWVWMHDYTQYELTGKLETIGFDPLDPGLRLKRFVRPFTDRFIELCDEVAAHPVFVREIALNKLRSKPCDHCTIWHRSDQTCEEAYTEWAAGMDRVKQWNDEMKETK